MISPDLTNSGCELTETVKLARNLYNPQIFHIRIWDVLLLQIGVRLIDADMHRIAASQVKIMESCIHVEVIMNIYLSCGIVLVPFKFYLTLIRAIHNSNCSR